MNLKIASGRQDQLEPCAAQLGLSNAHSAPVRVGHGRNDRQSQARTATLPIPRLVKACEPSKDRISLIGRDPRAVILDQQSDFVIARVEDETNGAGAMPHRVIDEVADGAL